MICSHQLGGDVSRRQTKISFLTSTLGEQAGCRRHYSPKHRKRILHMTPAINLDTQEHDHKIWFRWPRRAKRTDRWSVEAFVSKLWRSRFLPSSNRCIRRNPNALISQPSSPQNDRMHQCSSPKLFLLAAIIFSSSLHFTPPHDHTLVLISSNAISLHRRDTHIPHNGKRQGQRWLQGWYVFFSRAASSIRLLGMADGFVTGIGHWRTPYERRARI